MKLRFKPFFKDIFLTFIVQAITLIAMLSIYHLIAKNFGPEGIGEYSLVKRVISFWMPLLLLGLGIGLPRYIAMSRNTTQRSVYVKSGLFVIAISSFIFLILINIFKGSFAKIFFGTTEYVNLVLPFSFFLAGLILHSLVYSYFRGRLLVKTFNFLQIVNLAIAPLIILIFFKNLTIEILISLIGITTFGISFSFSLFFIKEFLGCIEVQELKNSLKELLKYGLPRVPTDFALAGLFSLGPIFAAHSTSVQKVGYLSISQSLLNMVAVTVAPLSTILLPKVSNAIIQGRQKVIRGNLNFLINAIFQCFIFILVQLLIFADVVVKFWLGSAFFDAIPVIRIVSIAIPFYVLYLALRSILDAVKVKPLNAINVSISLVSFMLIAGSLLFLFKFLNPIISLSIAFTSGLICLGTLTYISIRKIYPIKLKKDLNILGISIIISLFLGGITLLMKPFMISRLSYLIGLEVLVGILYLSILWLLKMEWIRQVPGKIVANRQTR